MKQKEDFRAVDFEDIFVWPDDYWCYRYEFSEHRQRSDDYKIIHFATAEYNEFLSNVVGD